MYSVPQLKQPSSPEIGETGPIDGVQSSGTAVYGHGSGVWRSTGRTSVPSSSYGIHKYASCSDSCSERKLAPPGPLLDPQVGQDPVVVGSSEVLHTHVCWVGFAVDLEELQLLAEELVL